MTEDGTDAADPAAPSSAEGDQFDLMAAEIALMLRNAREASHRLETEAQVKAKETTEAGATEAAALVAAAEAQCQTMADEAKALLDEATMLLGLAREHDLASRREADDYAAARRAELSDLVAEATGAREASGETLDRARQVLDDAERELNRCIEQTTSALAAFASIRESIAPVEQARSALGSPTVGDTEPADDDAPAATDEDTVIDLTDDRDASIRSAVAKAVERASQNPNTEP